MSETQNTTTVNTTEKVNKYKEEVLTVNAKLKEWKGTFGFCRSTLLSFHSSDEYTLLPYQARLLKLSKIKANYEFILEKVRISKAGNHSAFYILQCLKKHREELEKVFTDNDNAERAKKTDQKKAA